jgi:alkylation response protein AidB-like acyl-CoA dehydrogenase
MIEFELTKEQSIIQKSTREFAEKEIEPIAAELDQAPEHKFDWDVLKKLAENDFLRLTTRAEYGGVGIDRRTAAIVIEELAAACAGIAIMVAAHNVYGADVIENHGSEEQKQKYLHILCDTQKPALAGFAATEPSAGSDIASISTTARLEGDKYVIDGAKRFIVNGGVAALYITFAITDSNKSSGGLSSLIVPADTPGLSFNMMHSKMGQRASQTAEVIYDGVRVPKENLLAKEGDGFFIIMNTLNRGRPASTGAISIGVARAAYEAALKHARERVQFGEPIFQQQSISFMLADMATMIEAARLLNWRACWLIDNSLPYVKESAMAKLYCSDVAMKVTTDAVQILGGYGYMKDIPSEKYMRDAKILQIYEGTNQIQRLIVSNQL